MGSRYWCIHRDGNGTFSAHDSGAGKPPRKKCSYCGSKLVVEKGVWGVFEFTFENHYPREDALRTFKRREKANDYARDNRLVVRFIPDC